MPCALTQGYTLDCRDSIGGVKNTWLIESGNVSGIVSASGVITTIGKVTGKRFWKYSQKKFVAEAKEEFQGSDENGTAFWNQTIDISLIKLQAALRNEIILLGQNFIVAVVQDQNDKYWYYGEENGMSMTTSTAGTGKAGLDKNGYSLQFTGQERYLAKEVASGVIAGLETPG